MIFTASILVYICIIAVQSFSVDNSAAGSMAAHVIDSINPVEMNAVPDFAAWNGAVDTEDPLASIASFLQLPLDATPEEQVSFLQVDAHADAQKVHGYCELCILIMQMKERGQPHLCSGLNADYFISVSFFPFKDSLISYNLIILF